ncbi:MAG: hypothetical protein C4527_24660 [Candidatus Omnitrophota bacterium]|jgi:hypothetical protein|nr:MAG: hypothetical protein C4527_24660 [Candidatus Omnitrophota bacterium]
MSAPDFIVELIKAYAMILKAVWWPLVVLVIFFALYYRIGFNSRKKRTPMTWKGLSTLFANLERQHLSNRPLTEEERRRQQIVCRELQAAKNAAENQDEKTIYRVISTLSNLSTQNDKQLARQHLPDDRPPSLIDASEAIFQELDDKTTKEK